MMSMDTLLRQAAQTATERTTDEVRRCGARQALEEVYGLLCALKMVIAGEVDVHHVLALDSDGLWVYGVRVSVTPDFKYQVIALSTKERIACVSQPNDVLQIVTPQLLEYLATGMPGATSAQKWGEIERRLRDSLQEEEKRDKKRTRGGKKRAGGAGGKEDPDRGKPQA